MRIRYFLFALFAIAACAVCYSFGYFSGTKQSPLRENRSGELVYTLGLYQLAEATNWSRVKGGLAIELLSRTREYELRYGVPTGTNLFARKFSMAQTLSSQIESNLVPLSSILTNIPHSPDMKITVEKQKD